MKNILFLWLIYLLFWLFLRANFKLTNERCWSFCFVLILNWEFDGNYLNIFFYNFRLILCPPVAKIVPDPRPALPHPLLWLLRLPMCQSNDLSITKTAWTITITRIRSLKFSCIQPIQILSVILDSTKNPGSTKAIRPVFRNING